MHGPKVRRSLQTTCLAGSIACFALAGCAKQGTESTPKGAKAPPKAEERVNEWIGPYMRAAGDAVKRNDVEAATVELQGALNLLQQALVKQRQEQMEQPNALPAAPLIKMADEHQRVADDLANHQKWDAAAAHYQTMVSLLQVASDRESRRLSAETASFSQDYSKERDDIQKWYDEAQKDGKLTEDKRAEIQKEYQDKLRKVEEEWAHEREELNKKSEELRKQVEEQQTSLTQRRCKGFEAIAEVYNSKGEKQQAEYYTTMAYQEMARTLERNNDYAGAEAEYKKWLKARPDDVSARIGLARCLEQAGKQDEAAAQYREVLKKNPQDTNMRFQLASLLGRQQKWDGAIAQWKQIIEISREGLSAIKGDDPMSENQRKYLKSQMASHYWQLASACQQAKKTSDAKAAYAKAVELNPQLKASVPKELAD